MNLFAGARTAGRVAALAVLSLSLFAAPAPAAATDYDQLDFPVRPITAVVPFAKGGPTDTVARIVIAEMAKYLGQDIVVENILGAGGTLAASRVARANPDGYTLIVGHMGTHGAAVAIYPKLPYNPDKDFTPVALITELPVLLVARKGFPPTDLKQFAAYVKAHTDNINVAHAGVGSVSYASSLLLDRLLGVDPTGVPFSGTGPAMAALPAAAVTMLVAPGPMEVVTAIIRRRACALA